MFSILLFFLGTLHIVEKKTLDNFLLVLYIIAMCKEKNGKNVFGTELIPCCLDPITGYYRDGYCNTGISDTGSHIVCAEMTLDFLNFSKRKGNDLLTPIPEYDFKGLTTGDRWCLCADRWVEAYNNDIAPNILLEATHINILKKVEYDVLKKFSLELRKLN